MKVPSDYIEYIKKHEGYSPIPYRDTRGVVTGGFGHNLESDPLEPVEVMNLVNWALTNDQASLLKFWRAKLDKDVEHAIRQVDQTFWWSKDLPEPAYTVLVDMMYNMGIVKVMTFSRFLAAIRNHYWLISAVELLDSKYAEQTKTRALGNARALVGLAGMSLEDALGVLHSRNPDRAKVLRIYAQRTPGS